MKKGKGKNSGLLPSSLRIISSCLKTVSANAADVASSVRSAGASVAASISAAEDHKDQVTWAGFDKLEIGPSIVRHVLLLGYRNGFQAFDVEDASNFNELVSKRDGPVSFLQMQPLPARCDDLEGFGNSHPLLLVVAGDDSNYTALGRNCSQSCGIARENKAESMLGNGVNYPTTVRFFSLKSHSYVYVLRFRSSVCMVRCSSLVVAVGLATQIYCFDALTLESKFSVLMHPVPQLVGQGTISVNVGYGPLAVGPRWLAYAPKRPLSMNTGRLSPQSLISSPGGSPNVSPGGSSLMARYAMESTKQLAAGLINLGDMGYKSLSKYCQELLPDGSSSPVSPNSIWKVGGLAGSDAENAGMVAVKDFVSGAIISQFKAHTSPISALCFDPSGTLLVTASVCGNNINVFQIMPSSSRSVTGASYEWRSSHVHLYKLHRGITSAIIQDICFSHHGEWIAIISSKGTCHIFVLNPASGDDGLLSLSCQGEECARSPVSSLPWWFTPSYNQQSLSASSPVSLSVVSRIKYSSFGWLNTVSNAATPATGKVFVPSGAVAAVFHKSVTHERRQNSGPYALEHILVYTPSGHVVQHELQPSICMEVTKNGSTLRRASHVQVEDGDLKVKVEPIQWWDVCRRSDLLEKEECLSEVTTKRQHDMEMAPNNLLNHEDSCQLHLLDINNNCDEEMSSKPCDLKPHESSRCYLSNAEVQVSTGVLPVWQNSKISFHAMDSPRADSSTGGEFEIEEVTTCEVEIKEKKLLPVFYHFHSVKTCEDRFSMNYSHPSKLECRQANGNITHDTMNCHSKPASLSSTESSEGGLSRRMDNLLDLNHTSTNEMCPGIKVDMTNGYIHKAMIAELPGHKETQTEKQMTNGWSTSPTFHVSDQLPPIFSLALREEHCKAVEAEEKPKLSEVANGHSWEQRS